MRLVFAVMCLGVAAGAALFVWLYRMEKRSADLTVRDFAKAFPGRCPLCSYTRWGRAMGFESAFKAMEPHRCPDGNDDGTNPYLGDCP